MINVNFDGASVMSGYKSGVQKHFKVNQAALIYTHCVALKLELAVLDAIKLDDYLELFNSTINGIFKFYYYSIVRRKELRAIGELLHEEFKQLRLMKNISWLASQSRALSILATSYKVLVFDLESKSYGTNETASKAGGFVELITQPQFLFYLHFFQDIVSILKDVSLIFQRDTLLVCEIPRVIQKTYIKVESLSVTNGESLDRLIKDLSVIDNGAKKGYDPC